MRPRDCKTDESDEQSDEEGEVVVKASIRCATMRHVVQTNDAT